MSIIIYCQYLSLAMTIASRSEEPPVLLIGATGNLGRRTLRALRARGKLVRALVRPGSDGSGLSNDGVEVVRGDMLDPPSLARAMKGVAAVVSSAIGYSRQEDSDPLQTDLQGNRNLVDAAKKTGVPRFVYLSALACDQAPGVPLMWHKKLVEDYIRGQGIPFVSLRPGAFIGAPSGPFRKWMVEGLQQGRVMGLTPAGVRISYISPDETARAQALAVDEPRALGQCIDLGSDRTLSGPEFADLFGHILGRPMKTRSLGRGMMATTKFFRTGKFVADTRLQAELFGPVPKVEDEARLMLTELGLLPTVTKR